MHDKNLKDFSDEFKREAVKLGKQPGATVTQVARPHTSVSTNSLRPFDKWMAPVAT
jgi:transposase-like protein